MSENVNNKTCGECCFFESKEFICCYSGDETEARFTACLEFEPIPKPTNGDVIRQMSNEELATCIDELAFRFSSRREFVAWLNAPADCVTENGKSAKQADLCCKSAKESEGKDD